MARQPCEALVRDLELASKPVSFQGGRRVTDQKADLLKGTLDMLILKAVSLGPLHGYGISSCARCPKPTRSGSFSCGRCLRKAGTTTRYSVSPGNFLGWQEQSTSFERMAAFTDQRLNLTGSGERRRSRPTPWTRSSSGPSRRDETGVECGAAGLFSDDIQRCPGTLSGAARRRGRGTGCDGPDARVVEGGSLGSLLLRRRFCFADTWPTDKPRTPSG
jgi:hypothetical protein